MGADAASAFLIGRLAQEGRQPLALLTATSGRWRTLTGVHVFAVDGDRLWLAQPRLLGEPAVASVPLREVGEVTVRSGPERGGRGAALLEMELAHGALRLRILDDAEVCARFLDAVRGGRRP
jgi:hypothetical protein